MSKLCRNCGAPINLGDQKCIYCGFYLPEEPQMQPVSQETVNAPNPTSTPDSTPTPTPTPTIPTWFVPSAPIIPPSAPMPISTLQPVRTTISESNSGTSTDVRTGYDIFSRENWSDEWLKKNKSGKRVGIVLTNIDDISSPEKFVGSLERYIEKRSGAEIEYCLLDLATQKVARLSKLTCENIIGLLKKIYGVAVPTYLLIVGDHSVIPCAEWENECRDGDDTVPSDLAYITLDTDSPWDGADYSFGNLTRVGRIPTCANSNFKEAIQYFDNTVDFKPYKSAKSFAYSALVWEKTSKAAFAHLSPTLITSPKYTTDEKTASRGGLTLLKSLSNTFNLLCFNLHGSDASHVWYGQQGQSYPEAARKSILPTDTSGYAIVTEACYGARPAVKVGKEQSMVGYALTNKCVAFVGSTRIAYGQCDGGMSAADIIANTFTKHAAKGMTAGAAFLKALDELCRGRMNEVAVKTLAEFALYGDPSVTLIESNAPKTYSAASKICMSSPKKNPEKAFKLVPCGADAFTNYSLNDRAKIQLTAYSVRENGKGYMMSNFSSMSNVEPKIFKLMGGGGYRAVYSKVEGGINTVIRVHTDEQGNVESVYTSK